LGRVGGRRTNALAVTAATELRGRIRSKRKDGERASVENRRHIGLSRRRLHARRIVEAARGSIASTCWHDEFSAEVAGRCVRIMVRGRDAGEWDLFLTPRALGDDGDAE